MYARAAFSNTIVENNVSSNGLGILISDSSNNNTVLENFVSNNDYGLLLFSSNDTRVYHNSFINNTQQLLLSDSFNTAWDEGYPLGGNFWSDYSGADEFRGPNQDIPGGDGKGDGPYIIDQDNVDHYPLMSPWHAPGDVNVDGVVDGGDIAIVAKAFGSYGFGCLFPGSPPHPRWNGIADENEDNVIDGSDIVLIARNFGKAYP